MEERLSGLLRLQLLGGGLPVSLKRTPLGTAMSALMQALYCLSDATMVGVLGS